MDIGSRGPCWVLFSHGNLDTTSTARSIWQSPSDHGGSWKNSNSFLREGVLALHCAMPGSTLDTCLRQLLGAFGRILREGGTRILKSICPALLI